MDSTFITFQRISVDEAVDHGVVDGLGDAVGVKFLKDAFTVAFHRVKRLEHQPGDFLGGVTHGRIFENLRLLLGERDVGDRLPCAALQIQVPTLMRAVIEHQDGVITLLRGDGSHTQRQPDSPVGHHLEGRQLMVDG